MGEFIQKIRKKYRTVKAVGPEPFARTDGRTDVRTYESEFIGSFRSRKTSGEPISRCFMIYHETTQFIQPSNVMLTKAAPR